MLVGRTFLAVATALCLLSTFARANVNFNPESVYNGVVDPNNVAIHVIQNAFNFVTSSLGWLGVILLLGPSFNSGRSSTEGVPAFQWPREQVNYYAEGRSFDSTPSSAFEGLSMDKIAKVLRVVADGAETISG